MSYNPVSLQPSYTWRQKRNAMTDRVPSYKLPPAQDTLLADHLQQELGRHPGLSGVHPLITGTDAFLARIALTRLAQRSLDLQYYIWQRDSTGDMLAAQLLLAADRGVRVRLLLDDLGSPVGDRRLLMLSHHPNIEVRLFNPFFSRTRRFFSTMLSFGRINRRMHNKCLTADSLIAIVGGRNIGNEYFDANSELAFSDLDLMAIGPVVEEVSNSFDLYWNYEDSYPIEQLTRKTFNPQQLLRFYAKNRRLAEDTGADEYFTQLSELPLAREQNAIRWYWGRASLVSDHPDKGLEDNASENNLLTSQLAAMLGQVHSELMVISPYFIPRDQGVEFFRKLIAKGIKIVVMTNSLAATDVSLVHSGYRKFRKALLQAGVELYEMRPDAESNRSRPRRRKSLRRLGRISKSSRASLHAKAFFFDESITFVGSLNFDPRSLFINTEVGVMVQNAELTVMAVKSLKQAMQADAYQLRLDEAGEIRWINHKDGQREEFRSEPQASWLRRAMVWLFSLFPIESQL